ncbi:carboxylesterase/lipase family protein [Mycolicibacterium sp. 120270]|uniref:carboxylesterase/lipase family protein n=1 Tax=Mycolicibacterium sp. 120270 TaxID=3090600 RepID=UPI00299EE5A3|nr:carboxylesterase family protein [Mycolicibacterium sp. 120270]MDX1884609.1 carboxylesterase family protein [Mycolicibacterium sp. 120270]
MQRGTARSLRVVLLVVMATVLVVALGRFVGPRAAVPQILQPPSPVVPTPPSPQTDTSLVRTATGMVRGVVESDHRMFAGIPYAAPPVGPLRFRPPAPPVAWTGIRDATKPGPRCIQDPGVDPEFGKQSDEDCLNLNVWTPELTGSPRPVMVWIHGGSFTGGSGKIYDGRWLVTRDIIVVTINYRLGTLGFLADPSLGPPGDVGNYGFQDQQAALRWVKDNIANFGGDPGKVTVAGESAGGMSVCDHLVAPGSKGLFRAAIIQSAPCGAQADLGTAERRSVEYSAQVGCADPRTSAECLRALPVDKLRKPVSFFTIGEDEMPGPVTGSAALPVDPVTAIARNDAARVPVLIGTNRDEFTLFVALQYLRLGKVYTVDNYPELLRETFGANAAAVGDRYPPRNYGGGVPSAYAAAVTDAVFSCVAERMSDDLARTRPVYAYEFNDREAPAPEAMRTLPFPVGASHSLELRYIFEVGGAEPMTPEQQALSDQMLDYWSRFVTDAAPDAVGHPAWPPLGTDTAEQPWMSLQPDGSRVVTDFAGNHQCEFWANLAK